MSGRPVLYSDFHILITAVATGSLRLPIFLLLKRELVIQKAQKHSRPLILSSKTSCFKNEAKCETFLVKISFIVMRIKIRQYINGFALRLPLKQRRGTN